MGEVKDSDLLERVARGDHRAWEHIVKRHADLVYSLALGILGEPQDAEDAMQEAFIRIRSYAKKFTYGDSAKSWISTIACREALRMIDKRSKSRRRTVSISGIGEDAISDPVNIAGKAEEKEISSLLAGAVEALPEKIRTAVVMHYGAGLKQKQIAKELRCDQSTVSDRLRQGLALLRKKLGVMGVGGAALALAPADIFAGITNVRAPASAINKLVHLSKVTSSATSSVKAAAVVKGGNSIGLVLALSCVVVTVSATAVHFWGTGDSGKPEKKSPVAVTSFRQVTKSATKKETPKPFKMVLDFKTSEPMKYVKNVFGHKLEWTPNCGKNKGDGALRHNKPYSTDDQLSVCYLDVDLPEKPFRVNIGIYVRDTSIVAPIWSKHGGCAFFYDNTKSGKISGSSWYNHTIYMSKHKIVTFHDGRQVAQFVTYRLPESKIALRVIGNTTIAKIVIEEISEDEVPGISRYINAIWNIMPPKDRQGTVRVPELDDLCSPGKKAHVYFSQSFNFETMKNMPFNKEVYEWQTQIKKKK